MSYAYETLYILRPDLTEEQVQQEVSRYRDFLTQYNAEDLQVKVWGKRRLAYPIKKQQDGVYVQMNYRADGKQVAPMERTMRLSDEVIRYLTLKLDEDKVVIEQVPPSSPVVEHVPPSLPVIIPELSETEAEEDELVAAEE